MLARRGAVPAGRAGVLRRERVEVLADALPGGGRALRAVGVPAVRGRGAAVLSTAGVERARAGRLQDGADVRPVHGGLSIARRQRGGSNSTGGAQGGSGGGGGTGAGVLASSEIATNTVGPGQIMVV